MLSRKKPLHRMHEREQLLTPTFGSRYLGAPVPKYALPDQGMPAQVAYQIIHDELTLDGNPSSSWAKPRNRRERALELHRVS